MVGYFQDNIFKNQETSYGGLLCTCIGQFDIDLGHSGDPPYKFYEPEAKSHKGL